MAREIIVKEKDVCSIIPENSNECCEKNCPIWNGLKPPTNSKPTSNAFNLADGCLCKLGTKQKSPGIFVQCKILDVRCPVCNPQPGRTPTNSKQDKTK